MKHSRHRHHHHKKHRRHRHHRPHPKPLGPLTLKIRHEQMKTQKSDINEHQVALRDLAKQCSVVAELGVRSIVSSWSLAFGLSLAPGKKLLFLSDIDDPPSGSLLELKQASSLHEIKVDFIKGSDLESTFPVELFDFVFIDSWHVKGQLSRELERFAPRTTKFLAMHDTTIFGEQSEVALVTEDLIRLSGFTREEIAGGLWGAIEDFLISPEGRNWKVKQRYVNNNGLTVLERIQTPSS